MQEKYSFGLLGICVGLFFLFIGYSKWLLGKGLPIKELLPFLSLTAVNYLVFAVALLEIIIGICLILGILTRAAAWLGSAFLALYILGAVYLGKMGIIWSWIAIFGACLFIALSREKAKEVPSVSGVGDSDALGTMKSAMQIKSEIEKEAQKPKKRGRHKKAESYY
ncbi:DoxX family membrane protein [archaeon]|nr:DoxX family membrane protein [archaeon]